MRWHNAFFLLCDVTSGYLGAHKPYKEKIRSSALPQWVRRTFYVRGGGIQQRTRRATPALNRAVCGWLSVPPLVWPVPNLDTGQAESRAVGIEGVSIRAGPPEPKNDSNPQNKLVASLALNIWRRWTPCVFPAVQRYPASGFPFRRPVSFSTRPVPPFVTVKALFRPECAHTGSENLR